MPDIKPRLPEEFTRKWLKEAQTTYVHGVPITDLGRDELLAALAFAAERIFSSDHNKKEGG